VIVHNFYVVNIAIRPLETDAPLVVYADAVLSLSVAFECFQAIAGWLFQIVQCPCSMQIKQFSACRAFNRTELCDQYIVLRNMSINIATNAIALEMELIQTGIRQTVLV
jgi:hypothetical protein